MKFHTFVAASDHKAIAMVYEALGAEALVYSTKSIPGGVEILAALPDDKVEHLDLQSQPASQNETIEKIHPIETKREQKSTSDTSMFDKLNAQLQMISERVSHLSGFVDARNAEGFYINDDAQSKKRNSLHSQLSKMGFQGGFCQQFINSYFDKYQISSSITKTRIQNELKDLIKTTQKEIVDQSGVVALAGPTGIGKTTTVLKLAKRYISKYGSDSLGIITTDYHDIAGKNLLLHYRSLYNIDVEFADNPEELSFALKYMKKKRLILIDTNGVSQRDVGSVGQLVDLLNSQGDKLSTYVVLPCNVQEQILDEIARVFNPTNISGCILTKQDECLSTALAVGVSIKHNLKIAYVCNGQDVNKDIELANAKKICQQIFQVTNSDIKAD